MRRKKKTTVVTVESRERMTVSRISLPVVAWCKRCREEVLMVTPTEAAARSQTDVRSIFRLVAADEIHFIERDGVLLVCSRSVRG